MSHEAPDNLERIMLIIGLLDAVLKDESYSTILPALATVSGEAIARAGLPPHMTRAQALQLFCQQLSDTAAQTEDEDGYRPKSSR